MRTYGLGPCPRPVWPSPTPSPPCSRPVWPSPTLSPTCPRPVWPSPTLSPPCPRPVWPSPTLSPPCPRPVWPSLTPIGNGGAITKTTRTYCGQPCGDPRSGEPTGCPPFGSAGAANTRSTYPPLYETPNQIPLMRRKHVMVVAKREV